MQRPRYSFNPCWYGCVVYLCGGRSNSVERYDPREKVFCLLTGVLLPQDYLVWDATTFLDENTLVILSRNCISRVALSSQELIASERHPWYGVYSHCTPVTRSGLGFIVDLQDNGMMSVCMGVQLHTGAVEIEERTRN